MGRFKQRFKPSMFIDNIYDLDISRIKSLGIRGIIFDIDNTLVTYDDLVAPDHTKAWFEELHRAGIGTYLVSNNNEERVSAFAKSMNEPYYSKALKPRRRFLQRACDEMGLLPKETALAGDQLFTDIWGGNRMGMYTILVKAVSDKENWFVHLKRSLEKYILKDWL